MLADVKAIFEKGAAMVVVDSVISPVEVSGPES